MKSDAEWLALSRAEMRAGLAQGYTLSEIATASIGFAQTPEGRACSRAQNDELLLSRVYRAIVKADPKLEKFGISENTP